MLTGKGVNTQRVKLSIKMCWGKNKREDFLTRPHNPLLSGDSDLKSPLCMQKCGWGFFVGLRLVFFFIIWRLPRVMGEQGISNLLAFLVPCRWNVWVFTTNVPVLFMETYHLHSYLPWTSPLWTLEHVFQTVAVFVEFFIYPKPWR